LFNDVNRFVKGRITIIKTAAISMGIKPGFLSSLRKLNQSLLIAFEIINAATVNIPNEVTACIYFKNAMAFGFFRSSAIVTISSILIAKIKIPVR